MAQQALSKWYASPLTAVPQFETPVLWNTVSKAVFSNNCNPSCPNIAYQRQAAEQRNQRPTLKTDDGPPPPPPPVYGCKHLCRPWWAPAAAGPWTSCANLNCWNGSSWNSTCARGGTTNSSCGAGPTGGGRCTSTRFHQPEACTNGAVGLNISGKCVVAPPPPPLPTGTYKCLNGSGGNPLSGNVTVDGKVLYNSTISNCACGAGCGSCDCCHDYVSDCKLCVETKCLAKRTGANQTHFACGGLPHARVSSQNLRHPGPSPVVCGAVPLEYNRCLNSSAPGISTGQMEYTSSSCLNAQGSSACAGFAWTPGVGTGGFGAPAGTPFPFAPFNASVCTSARSPNGGHQCTVCNACCQDNVDCALCVRSMCPPKDRWICKGGSGRHQGSSCVRLDSPLNSSGTTGGYVGAAFADANCTRCAPDSPIACPTPSGKQSQARCGCGACPTPPGPPAKNSKTSCSEPNSCQWSCYGSKCLKVSNRTFSSGQFNSSSCTSAAAPQSCGKPAPPQPPPPGPPKPPPPPPPPQMIGHSLEDIDPQAVCIDGTPASVAVFKNPVASTDWLISLGPGSGGTFNICIGKSYCSKFGSVSIPGVPPAPPKPPANVSLQAVGPQSLDPVENPTFHSFNHAMLDLCDFTLLMGSGNLSIKGSGNCPLPGTCCAQPVATFRGRNILSASLKKLAALGMASATSILFTGVTWGGTAVILNLDFIASELKTLAPNAKKVRGLPVDAIQPRITKACNAPKALPPAVAACSPKPWLDDALFNLDHLANLTAHASPGCLAKNAANASRCLYAAQELEFVKTPLFLLQQLTATWTMQVLMDGTPNPKSILQVQGSVRGPSYNCAQYSDFCPPPIVGEYIVPAQQQVLAAAANHAGFLHGCYLGVYLYSGMNTRTPGKIKGIWRIIKIGGKTIQQAITDWWEADDGDAAASKLYADTVWNASGLPPKTVNLCPPQSSERWWNTTLAARPDAAFFGPGVHGQRGPPPVPNYTSRFMTNPTCRCMPWY